MANGTWLAGAGPATTEGYVEGNAAQYSWLVPQDYPGLFRAMGGRRRAARRLDAFLTRLNAGQNRPFAFLGNEPSLATPWLFDYLGRPALATSAARRALRLHRPTPGGMPGNDDGGTLSAWWVFGALGLYPARPPTDELALSAPLFRRARLRLPGGVLEINAPARAGRRSGAAPGIAVNGRPVRDSVLRFEQIAAGGRLRLAGLRP